MQKKQQNKQISSHSVYLKFKHIKASLISMTSHLNYACERHLTLARTQVNPSTNTSKITHCLYYLNSRKNMRQQDNLCFLSSLQAVIGLIIGQLTTFQTKYMYLLSNGPSCCTHTSVKCNLPKGYLTSTATALTLFYNQQ